jgi:hypothetical protein
MADTLHSADAAAATDALAPGPVSSAWREQALVRIALRAPGNDYTVHRRPTVSIGSRG